MDILTFIDKVNQKFDKQAEPRYNTKKYFMGGSVTTPKRGLVDEPGSYAGKSAAERMREYRERNPYKLKTTDIVVDGVKYTIPNNAMKPESAKGFIKFLNKLEKDPTKLKLINNELDQAKNALKAYINKNLKISNHIEFAKTDPDYVMEGFRFDSANNLWTSCGDGVAC